MPKITVRRFTPMSHIRGSVTTARRTGQIVRPECPAPIGKAGAYASPVASETSDVLIVGAGIAGTTVALELASAGMSVTMLERRNVGGGSSSLNAGGIRQQFSQEINVRVAVNTVHRISALREEFGEDVAYRRAGYL